MKGTFMASFKYDISVINTDVGKLNALSNKEINDLTIETQNAGDTIDKIRELIPQLNALHRSINNLIEATATVTQATLDQVIELDDDFAEILEQ